MMGTQLYLITLGVRTYKLYANACQISLYRFNFVLSSVRRSVCPPVCPSHLSENFGFTFLMFGSSHGFPFVHPYVHASVRLMLVQLFLNLAFYCIDLHMPSHSSTLSFVLLFIQVLLGLVYPFEISK